MAITSEQILDVLQDVADGLEEEEAVLTPKGTLLTLGTEEDVEELLADPSLIQEELNSSFNAVVNSLNSHYEPGWEFVNYQDEVTEDGNPRYLLHENSGVIMRADHYIQGTIHRVRLIWMTRGVRL